MNWQSYDLNGNRLPAPKGLIICEPNNWLRRVLYFFGAPRRWTRKV